MRALVLAEVRAQIACRSSPAASGLYFKALTHGLSAVPPIPAEYAKPCAGARTRRRRGAARGIDAARSGIRGTPEAARRIRIARALEVVEATGRSLTDWHRDGLPPLLPPGQFSALFLSPDREPALCAIDSRYEAMLSAGALEEVAALAARRLDPLLPAMKPMAFPALIRPPQGRDLAATGGGDRPRRYPPLRQAAIHLVPAPTAGIEWVRPDEARGWFDQNRADSR